MNISLHPKNTSGLLKNICNWSWESCPSSSTMKLAECILLRPSSYVRTHAGTEMYALAFRAVLTGSHIPSLFYCAFFLLLFGPLLQVHVLEDRPLVKDEVKLHGCILFCFSSSLYFHPKLTWNADFFHPSFQIFNGDWHAGEMDLGSWWGNGGLVPSEKKLFMRVFPMWVRFDSGQDSLAVL